MSSNDRVSNPINPCFKQIAELSEKVRIIETKVESLKKENSEIREDYERLFLASVLSTLERIEVKLLQ